VRSMAADTEAVSAASDVEGAPFAAAVARSSGVVEFTARRVRALAALNGCRHPLKFTDPPTSKVWVWAARARLDPTPM